MLLYTGLGWEENRFLHGRCYGYLGQDEGQSMGLGLKIMGRTVRCWIRKMGERVGLKIKIMKEIL